MGLFDKPKIPGIDTAALTRIAEQNAAKQRELLGQKKLGLDPLNQKFQADRTAFSAQIEPGAENLLTRFGQDLSNVGAQEKTANEAAGIAQREQSFRDVPAMQRAIRESLGGSGLLRSGGAVGQVAQPIIDAARSSRDFTSNLETTRLGNEARRSEGLAATGFDARTAALNQRLGFDENTMNTLAELGRTDLIDEYNSLAGIEGDLGNARLSIEQARQANAIEQAKASASRRAGIIGSLGSLAGAGIGAFGGPMGIALGSQIGGAVGNFAGGGTPQGFDPTLLVALAQQRQTANSNRQNAIRNSLGGRGY